MLISFQPSTNAWVYIRKSIIQPKGSPDTIMWSHHLNYLSDVAVNDYFKVKFVMENFAGKKNFILQ